MKILKTLRSLLCLLGRGRVEEEEELPNRRVSWARYRGVTFYTPPGSSSPSYYNMDNRQTGQVVVTPSQAQFDPTTPYHNVDIYRATPAVVVTPEPGDTEPGIQEHVYEAIWEHQLPIIVPVEVHQPEETWRPWRPW